MAKMLAKCGSLEVVQFTGHCSSRLIYRRKGPVEDFDGLGQGFDDLLGPFDTGKAQGVVIFEKTR